MYYLYLCTPRVDLDPCFEVSKDEEREGKKARARGQLGQGAVVSCLSVPLGLPASPAGAFPP